MMGMVSFLICLLAASLDVQSIMAFATGHQSRIADVAGIRAKRLHRLVLGSRPGTDDGPQCGSQQFAVMHVGPAADERQRDATGVH